MVNTASKGNGHQNRKRTISTRPSNGKKTKKMSEHDVNNILEEIEELQLLIKDEEYNEAHHNRLKILYKQVEEVPHTNVTLINGNMHIFKVDEINILKVKIAQWLDTFNLCIEILNKTNHKVIKKGKLPEDKNGVIHLYAQNQQFAMEKELKNYSFDRWSDCLRAHVDLKDFDVLLRIIKVSPTVAKNPSNFCIEVTQWSDEWNSNDKACVTLIQTLYKHGIDGLTHSKDQNYPFFEAIRENYPKTVEELIHRGASATNSNNGIFPLNIASHGGAPASLDGKQVEVVNVLLSHGAEIDREGPCGDNECPCIRTPLQIACGSFNLHVSNFLIDKGADFTKVLNNWSPIISACDELEFGFVKKFKELGMSLTVTDKEGNNPLHLVSKYDSWNSGKKNKRALQLKLIQYLVSNGAKIHQRNLEGYTPLLVAAQNYNRELVDYFIKNGADPHTCNDNGENCFHLFPQNFLNLLHDDIPFKYKKEVILCFIKADVDINKGDEKRRTPFLNNIKYMNMPMIEFYIKNGADPTAIDDNGNNALHHLALGLWKCTYRDEVEEIEEDLEEIFFWLVKNGVSLKLKNKIANCTPRKMFADFGWVQKNQKFIKKE